MSQVQLDRPAATDSMAPMLLNIAQVCQLLGLSQPSFYRLRTEGKFVAPVATITLPRWRRSDVEAWIASLPPQAAPSQSSS